jgi:hypothetical protein
VPTHSRGGRRFFCGDGHGAWPIPQGLEGRDHWMHAPRLPLCWQYRCEPREAFGVLINRPDVFWKADVLSRCRTDHYRAPPQVGGAPSGPARLAASLSEHAGCETDLGILEIADGVCTRPGEVADGCICAVGDRDQGESA